jgi:hypothetical protein
MSHFYFKRHGTLESGNIRIRFNYRVIHIACNTTASESASDRGARADYGIYTVGKDEIKVERSIKTVYSGPIKAENGWI